MKMFHVLSLAGALALPFAASSASAQQQPQQHGSDDYIHQPVRLDKSFDQTLPNGCKYSLSVRGTITPSPESPQQSGSTPVVTPHIAVSAQTVCPATAAVKVTDDVLGSGPLTWQQLQDSISSRSHVFTVENNHACTYGATMKIVDRQLQIQNFDHNCRAL